MDRPSLQAAPPPPDDQAAREAAARAETSLEVSTELASRLVAQDDLDSAASLAVDAVSRCLAVDRVYCRLLGPDRETTTVASDGPGFRALDPAPVAAGLTGCVLARNTEVFSFAAERDERFARAIDDPAGDATAAWAGVPIPGSAGHPIGVLFAVRSAASSSFDAWDRACLRLIAQLAAPVLGALGERRRQNESHYREQIERGRPLHLFRKQALDAQAAEGWRKGEPLDVEEPWYRWAYWFLVIVLVGGLAVAASTRRPVRAPVIAVVLPPSGALAAEGSLRVAALVPASASGRVEVGSETRLVVEGVEPVTLTVRRLGGEIESAARGARVLGITEEQVLGDPPFRWIEATSSNRAPAIVSGTAATLQVVVEDEPLVVSLFPGLRRAMGRGGD